MNRAEQALQIAVCEMLTYGLPRDAFYFAVRNEGKRGKAEAGVAIAMGLKPGMSDLVIFYRGRAFCIELKGTKSGMLSRKQGDVRLLLQAAKTPYAVCNNLDQIEGLLKHWHIPCRVRISA